MRHQHRLTTEVTATITAQGASLQAQWAILSEHGDENFGMSEQSLVHDCHALMRLIFLANTQ